MLTKQAQQQGFTLFEVLIYIALFSVIVGGGVLTALNIFEGTARINVATRSEAEINFMLRKLDWALGGGTITDPSPGFSSDELTVNKSGNSYRFFTDSDGVFMLENSGDEYPLTDIISVDDIEFEYQNGDPDQLIIDLTIDGETLAPITRYVRTN